jgi:hypothetical protein
MIYIHCCQRCEHIWESKEGHPKRCAKCKTPYWDKERPGERLLRPFITSITISTLAIKGVRF